MQNNQIQEPVAETDGERLRPHAVSIYISQLKKNEQSEAYQHKKPLSYYFQTIYSCVELHIVF